MSCERPYRGHHRSIIDCILSKRNGLVITSYMPHSKQACTSCGIALAVRPMMGV